MSHPELLFYQLFYSKLTPVYPNIRFGKVQTHNFFNNHLQQTSGVEREISGWKAL